MRFLRQPLLALFGLAVIALVPSLALAQQAPPPAGVQQGSFQTGQGQAGGPQGARGQQQQRPPGRAGMPGPGDDAMGRFFFLPQQVLDAGDEIGLQPEQRQAVEALMEESAASFPERRYQLGNEMTKIAGLAVDQPIDEAAILEQLERVLELERQIKREQLLLLVRVKNLLTPEQQAQLASARRDPNARRQERF